MNKKVLIIINNYEYGGAEKNYVNLANYLYNKRYDVRILTINKQGDLKKILQNNVSILALNKSRLLFSIPKILKDIKYFQPDYIFTSLPHFNITFLFLKKLFFFKAKIIIREANTVDPDFQDNKLKNFFLIQLKKFIYKNAFKVIAITETVKKNLIYYQKIYPKNIITIYNPIYNDKSFDNQIQINDNKFQWIKNYKHPIILSVGRLVKQKDFKTLIHSFFLLRKNKKLKLIIIGNGYQKKSLHDLSIKLNLENDILFIKSTSNVYFFLKYSSIFVCSSLWEGTPTILAEALKTQIPIVTSNFPSAYELLSDSTNFRIAKRNNSKDLSKKINEILSKNYVKNKNQMWKNFTFKNFTNYENLLK